MAVFAIKKSTLFMEQWLSYAQGYHDRAGMTIAQRFICAVQDAVNFIGQNPYACAIYDPGEGYEDLRAYYFRKWDLRDFPHKVLFRLGENATIFIEVLYAHKMDIPSRLVTDVAKQARHQSLLASSKASEQETAAFIDNVADLGSPE